MLTPFLGNQFSFIKKGCRKHLYTYNYTYIYFKCPLGIVLDLFPDKYENF